MLLRIIVAFLVGESNWQRKILLLFFCLFLTKTATTTVSLIKCHKAKITFCLKVKFADSVATV